MRPISRFHATVAAVAFFALTLLTPALAAATPFSLETAHSDPSLGSFSGALAPNGEACFAYVVTSGPGAGLHFTRKVEGYWTSEPVLSPWPGFHGPSLAINAQGVPFIAFTDGSTIRMATRGAGGVWTTETVLTGLNGPMSVEARITPSGYPAIGYIGTGISVYVLNYKEKSAAGWGASEVIALGVKPVPFGLTYDPGTGQARASCTLDVSGGRPTHAWRTGTSWSTEPVETASTQGNYGTDIRVAPDGTIGVAFSSDAGGGANIRLKYAQKVGTWSSVFIGSFEFPREPRLGMDNSGAPRISYLGGSGAQARTVVRTGSTWGTPETVETAAANLVAFDAIVDGVNPALFYRTAAGLRVADAGIRIYWPVAGAVHGQNQNGWIRWGGVGDVVIEAQQDNGPDWTYLASMTGTGGLNAPYSIPTPSYFISAECRLRITRAVQPTTAVSSLFTVLGSNNRPWTPQTVDATGVTGQFPSAASDGWTTGVSYFDATNSTLRFASSCSGGPWTSEPVAVGVGALSSLKFRAGEPWIAYVAGSSLKLARRQWGTWTVENVWTAPSGSISRPSLAFNPAGEPRVVFYNADYVRYLAKTGGTWPATPEPVDNAPLNGYGSLAITSTGEARVGVFREWSSPSLRYYSRSAGGTWSFEDVQTGSNKGYFVALALDASNQPHMAYVDLSNSGSKKVRLSEKAPSWTHTTVRQTAGSLNVYTDIALNSAGQAFVPYWSHGLAQVYGPGTGGAPAAVNVLSGGSFGAMAITMSPTGNPRALLNASTGGDLVAYVSVPDEVLPAPVTNVTAALGRTTAVVSFSETGDDDQTCPATEWELRSASAPITEGSWGGAGIVASGTAAGPGTTHCVTLNVASCSPYYFAAKMKDDAGQWSLVGNSPGGTTKCSGSIQYICADGMAAPASILEADIPATLELAAPSPNPSTTASTFELAIPRSSAGQDISLSAFDVRGRRVAVIHQGSLEPGRHVVRWNLEGSDGARVASGMYYLRLRAGAQVTSRPLLVLAP